MNLNPRPHLGQPSDAHSFTGSDRSWHWHPTAPEAALLDKRLTPLAYRVLCYLAHRCGPHRSTWVSNSTIGEDLGVSVDTVQRALKLLAATGWITRTPDGSVKRGEALCLAWSPTELLGVPDRVDGPAAAVHPLNAFTPRSDAPPPPAAVHPERTTGKELHPPLQGEINLKLNVSPTQTTGGTKDPSKPKTPRKAKAVTRPTPPPREDQTIEEAVRSIPGDYDSIRFVAQAVAHKLGMEKHTGYLVDRLKEVHAGQPPDRFLDAMQAAEKAAAEYRWGQFKTVWDNWRRFVTSKPAVQAPAPEAPRKERIRPTSEDEVRAFVEETIDTAVLLKVRSVWDFVSKAVNEEFVEVFDENRKPIIDVAGITTLALFAAGHGPYQKRPHTIPPSAKPMSPHQQKMEAIRLYHEKIKAKLDEEEADESVASTSSLQPVGV